MGSGRTEGQPVEEYRRWPELNPGPKQAALLVFAGHDLVCWFPPGAACHADVLLEVANARVGGPVTNPPRPPGKLAFVCDGSVVALRGVAGVSALAPLNVRSGPELARMVTEISPTADRAARTQAARGEELSAARLHRASVGKVGFASALPAAEFGIDQLASRLIAGKRCPALEEDNSPWFGIRPSRERDLGFER